MPQLSLFRTDDYALSRRSRAVVPEEKLDAPKRIPVVERVASAQIEMFAPGGSITDHRDLAIALARRNFARSQFPQNLQRDLGITPEHSVDEWAELLRVARGQKAKEDTEAESRRGEFVLRLGYGAVVAMENNAFGYHGPPWSH